MAFNHIFSIKNPQKKILVSTLTLIFHSPGKILNKFMSKFPKTFTKRVKGSGVVSGICTRQEFNLEVKVLKKLQSMYECDCFPEETRVHSTTRHFPIVHDIDSKKKKIIMSYQGRPLNKLRYCRKKFSIPNWTEQLHCIVANLNRCRIKHLDITPSEI